MRRIAQVPCLDRSSIFRNRPGSGPSARSSSCLTTSDWSACVTSRQRLPACAPAIDSTSSASKPWLRQLISKHASTCPRHLPGLRQLSRAKDVNTSSSERRNRSTGAARKVPSHDTLDTATAFATVEGDDQEMVTGFRRGRDPYLPRTHMRRVHRTHRWGWWWRLRVTAHSRSGRWVSVCFCLERCCSVWLESVELSIDDPGAAVLEVSIGGWLGRLRFVECFVDTLRNFDQHPLKAFHVCDLGGVGN